MNGDIFDIINPTNTLCMSRPLTHIIGALETMVYGALLAKFSYYKKNNMLDDGWFYSTIPDLYESTSLSAFKQKRCIMTLESFGLIETKNRGLPARRSFRIINDTELISNLIAKGVEKMRSIKPEAALSYEKKRKPSDEPALSEYGCDEDENDTVLEESESLSACEQDTQQQAPKEFDNLLQRNCETCSEIFTAPSSLYKTTVNNHQSINQQAPPDRIDVPQTSPVVSSSQRAEYLELIKENIDYDCLMEQNSNRQDRIEYFIPDYFFKGGFPESIEKISEALKGEKPVSEFIDGLTDLMKRYEADKSVMRFNFHKMPEILESLKDLQLERREFRAEKDFEFAPVFFISEEEKDLLLLEGSGVQGGKFRMHFWRAQPLKSAIEYSTS
ncbi:MAG: hypothetical protein ACI4WS_07920 [Oscillospiraceae bacterium]